MSVSSSVPAATSVSAPTSAPAGKSAVPDGFDAWVHFSAIEIAGFRALEAGDLNSRLLHCP
jgi:hypothetical protein